MKRDCVEHFTDARNSWTGGVAGFFLQYRGIGTVLGLGIFGSLIGGGWFSWVDFFQKLSANTADTAGYLSVPRPLIPWILFLFAFLILVFSLIIVRVKTIRSLNTKWYMHELAHFLRNKSVWAVEVKSFKNAIHKHNEFKSYCDQTCEKVREYFSHLLNDDTVGCALRMVNSNPRDQQNPSVHFCTMGRAGLNTLRDKTSEPIDATEGVPAFFLDKRRGGVLIYNNLDKAMQKGVFKRTKNEDIYRDEIKTLMVAPVNGCSGKREDMIGLLFVTSRKDRFRQNHVDCMRMVADMIGDNCPKIVEAIYGQSRI